MAGRSASRVAYDDASATNRDAYLQRIIDCCGTGDVSLILRRVVALVEAGETGVSIAARLNGPARLPRIESELLESITPPAPDTRSTLPAIRQRPRTDVEAAAAARLHRHMVSVGAKPKTPPAERPPKAEPKKPRPVKRPAPQRNGSSRPGGIVQRVDTDHDGTRWRVGTCETCAAEFRHPMQRGRFPLTCPTCR